MNLFEELDGVCLDLVGFRDDHARFFRAGQVIEERRRPIVLQDVAQRDDRDLIDRGD